MARARHTPQTWIDAGLKSLTRIGPDGLRAETLARELGTTKGSFYWHFKDVPAFQSAALRHWSETTKARYAAALQSGETSAQQLRTLGQVKPRAPDLAVRAWAVHDPGARRVVAKLDKWVLAEISARLTQLDATHPDFPGLIHAAMMASPAKGQHAETLIDMLLMLK